MADYYPLLARAVAALPESTPEARRSIYERARKALLGQLRRVDPPVPEEDIERENTALDAAIARLEADLESKGRKAEETAPASQAPGPAPGPAPAPAPAASAPFQGPPAPRQPASGEPTRSATQASVAAAQGPAGPAAEPPAPRAQDEAPAPKAPAEPAPPQAEPPPAVTKPALPAAPASPPRAGSLGARSAPRAPQTSPVAPAAPISKPSAPPRVEPAPPADRPAARPSLAPNIARERIWPPPSRAGAAAPTEAAPVPPVVAPKPGAGAAPAAAVPPIVAEAPVSPARPVPAIEPESAHPAASERAPASAPLAPVEGDRPRAKPQQAGPLSRLRLFARPRETEKAASFDEALGGASRSERGRAAAREPAAQEPVRPIAPQPPLQRGSTVRYWVFAGVLLLVVAGIATLAFRLRDNPEDFARVTRPNPGTESSESQSGKIVERIGAGPSTGGQRAATPVPQPQSQPQPQPQPTTPGTPAPQPAPAPAAPAPFVPVAHRAALLIEAPDDPQHVKTYVGTVLWRIDRASSGPPALVADIDLPDARFKATMRISKNTDPRLPASHTIDLRFTTAPDGEIPDVKEIDTLQMRAEDRPAGEPLSGIPAAITTNYFLIGLTGSDSAQSRNIDLMRNRGWFDLPMLLVNGKIAKITFEKGATGERMLNEVLAAWGSS